MLGKTVMQRDVAALLSALLYLSSAENRTRRYAELLVSVLQLDNKMARNQKQSLSRNCFRDDDCRFVCLSNTVSVRKKQNILKILHRLLS